MDSTQTEDSYDWQYAFDIPSDQTDLFYDQTWLDYNNHESETACPGQDFQVLNPVTAVCADPAVDPDELLEGNPSALSIWMGQGLPNEELPTSNQLCPISHEGAQLGLDCA